MIAVASKQFLIVDDMPEAFKVQGTIDTIGIVYDDAVVHIAENQTEALRLALSRDYDFILMDYYLADGATGVEVTAALRAAGVKTMIVAFSTETDRPEVCEHFRAAGANAGIAPLFLMRYLKSMKEGGDYQQYDRLAKTVGR
jgi:CheY-like chemotaxis protein